MCTTCASPKRRRTTGSRPEGRRDDFFLARQPSCGGPCFFGTPAPPAHDAMNHDKILILDFGSQVTQLIARRVREASVYCEIHPADVSDAFVREFSAEGRDPVGQPHVGVRGGDRPGAAGGVRARRAGARHLLRHADDGAAARRPRRGRAHARVRLRRSAGARPHAPARRHRGRAQPRGLRPAEGLDEPRRQGGRDAARLQADGVDRKLPGRRHGRRGPPVLRGAVPSGGDAHAAGPGDPATASCSRSAAARPTG